MPRLGKFDAGAFAVVMATGIVAIAAAEEGLPLLSDALLALACLAWVALATMLALRGFRAGRCVTAGRPRLHAFALVAATAVLGSRLAQAGAGITGLALWGLAFALWVLLLLLHPTLREARGSSLLLVVATESLAVLAALLAAAWGTAFLVVALIGWLVGLVLYPLVIVLIALAARRHLRFEPDLWIVMGALAIATLAGSELLLATQQLHSLSELGAGLHDLNLATWGCASLLIVPLLLSELMSRSRWRYQLSRWSFVFPLGMYAVASDALAQADRYSFLTQIGRVFFFIALAAWTLVLLGLARRTVGLGPHSP